MKLKLFFLIVSLTSIVGMKAQNIKNHTISQGRMFAFWGWNRAAYTSSDITFTGADYDFKLSNVVAHDRPTPFNFKDYFHPAWVTIPQTDARIGYFFRDKMAIVLGVDHMKYVMDQNQTVNFNGNISNETYRKYVVNNKIDLTDGNFLKYEHTDGLNYINIGVEQYLPIFDKKNINISIGYGGGIGGVVPKTNSTLMNNERSDRFNLAGWGADIRANINAYFWQRLLARVEWKNGFIHLPKVNTTLHSVDRGSQHFWFTQLNFGIGYSFYLPKFKTRPTKQ